MDLTPYLETLRADLAAAAAPGGPETTRAAEMLGHSLESSARLALLEALSDAAAEITTRLGTASVDVRLRGRDADFQVTDVSPHEEAPAPVGPPVVDGGDLARITLRLAEPIKEHVERAAAAEGISVNAWLVRAVLSALPRDRSTPAGTQNPPHGKGRGRSSGKRITGFAQA
jgi:uncharacterized protein DUF1778